jgi:hypothetical protein
MNLKESDQDTSACLTAMKRPPRENAARGCWHLNDEGPIRPLKFMGVYRRLVSGQPT